MSPVFSCSELRTLLVAAGLAIATASGTAQQTPASMPAHADGPLVMKLYSP